MESEKVKRREFLQAAGISAMAAGAALTASGEREASAAADPAWCFAVISDPHLSEDRPGELSGLEKFRRVLDRCARLQPRPEFLLLLGDLHLKKFEPLLPDIPFPLHVIAGNHEGVAERRRLRALFPADFQERDFYAFTRRDCRFLGMCTALEGDHVGHFESQTITPEVGQCEWLEKELAARPAAQRLFLFAHIPPEPEDRPNGMCLGQPESRYLHALVRRYRPTACFFGHRHMSITDQVANTTLYGVRSCNWNFHAEPTGFLQVRVAPAQVNVQFISTAE